MGAVSRRQALATLGCLGAAGALAAFGGRVAWVNAGTYRPPETVHHAMGEWFDFDGAYVYRELNENTKGYRLRVSNAEILSYNEFVRRYTVHTYEPIEGVDVPAIVCLTIDIQNDGPTPPTQGGMYFNEMYLIPKRMNTRMPPDVLLFESTIPQFREALATTKVPLNGLAVDIGTVVTAHMPYVNMGGVVDHNGQQVEEEYFKPVTDTSFELRVANMPQRHVIDIEI